MPPAGRCRCPRDEVRSPVGLPSDCISRQAPRARRRASQRAARPPFHRPIGGPCPGPAKRARSCGVGPVRAPCGRPVPARWWPGVLGPTGGWAAGPLPWRGVRSVSTGAVRSRGLGEHCGGGGGRGRWGSLRLWRSGRPMEGSRASPARRGCGSGYLTLCSLLCLVSIPSCCSDPRTLIPCCITA